MKIGIIGAGKFGLVLARIAAENSNGLIIQDAQMKFNHYQKMKAYQDIFNGMPISATQDLDRLNECDALLVTVASKDFRIHQQA